MPLMLPRLFRSRTAALVVTGLVLLSVAVASPTATAATTLSVEISDATADPDHAFEPFDAPAMAVGDFDGDGRAELVAHNDNQYVYVLSATDSRVLAEFRPPYPADWGVRPLTSPVVADVDADGRLDIVVVTSAAQTCVYEYDPGSSSSTSFDFDRRWCHRADRFGSSPAADGGARVADVDGDGTLEIFMQTEEKGLFAYEHDGAVRWAKDEWGGNAGPLVADVDSDGRLDVVFFSDGGSVRALDAASGNQKWHTDADRMVWPASIPVAGNAADLDRDGTMEIVFTARDAHDSSDYSNNHLAIVVLDHRGNVEWMRQPSWGNPMSYTHPVLHDVTGDGRLEIILQDWNTIGHKPGSWERLGPANVFAYRHDGGLLWRTQLDNSWSNDDVALADPDGDGRLEVMAVGPGAGGDGVWYLNAGTGTKERHVASGGWEVLRGPVAGDFDGSGDLDWAVSVKDGNSGGVLVFDTDAACWAPFGGWSNPSPCAPVTGGGGSAPPDEPSGDFSATFDTPGGNEWWVEVYVDANRDLAGVDARANGGAWIALDHKSWGAWAESFRVEEGSIVEFRARAAGGGSVVSDGYVWPSGEPASGGGGGGGGDFDASFRTDGGNEWWIEVSVDANKPLAGVDARIDGGDWFALELRSWGEWAANARVDDGSIVEFRARATTGERDTSGGYVWPSGEPASGGSFSADFRNERGNEWWIEVEVRASKPLAGVDARIDGGSWFALDHTDWDSWAKSRHAPAGSDVQFRARSTSGDSATSGSYDWPPS